MSPRDFRHPDVRLRNIEPKDLPLLYEWQLDPESNRLAVTNPRSREDFLTHWTSVLSDPEVKASAILVGDELLGHVACFVHDGQTNVGYWVNRNNWGKGIATRALELLLLEVPFRPLYARVASSNLASLRVLQKCGFVVERVQLSPATNRYPACEETILVLNASEQYTPGATQNASDFMARRTIASHGQFFLAHLTPGVSVLDCGCGPGTISLSIAQRIAPGRLVGIDRELSQIEKAQTTALQTGYANTEFQSAEIYALPFLDNSFDRVFSHALIEHLSDPIRAAKEMFRVLKPGGIIGLCSPDWGGFVLAPPSPQLTQAIAAYTSLQNNNGGDVQAGRKLGAHLKAAGFETIQMSARYECYDSLAVIGEYLALQLVRAGDSDSAETLREWSRSDDGMFAQCWVSCVARKPLV